MEIERRHGVRNSLVSAWVKRYLEEGEDALEPKNGNPYAALHTSKTLSAQCFARVQRCVRVSVLWLQGIFSFFQIPLHPSRH